jgi:hypothetical protein
VGQGQGRALCGGKGVSRTGGAWRVGWRQGAELRQEGLSAKTVPVLPGAPLSADSVITRSVRVAGGRFAPGHLGS